ncbi:MAG: carbonate dehydratase [Minwuia sp.]|uniref:carbonate dehydratase n=1 Tax=Minwuia sp. TaxID=2493630 RepID=UPI003A8523A2
MTIKTPADLLEENVRWADERTSEDADYFKHLSELQTPDFLWIGCSDSRVPANVITGLAPGEVFVHRNVANIVYTADLNCMSVVQFAVESLKVKHIIICGHYGCGGVKAALEDASDGLVEHWLEPVRDLKRVHRSELDQLSDHASRLDRLCELNVKAQVDALCHSPILNRAWEREQDLTVHGWIYGLKNGRLRDLECTRSGPPADARSSGAS